MKKILKISKLSLIIIISIITFIYFIGNILKFFIYNEYYAVKTPVAPNQGLNDGFVSQGIDYLPGLDLYITSGYMTNKQKASRVYLSNGKFFELEVLKNGIKQPYTGHCGGIAVSEHYGLIFLTSSSGLYKIELNQLLSQLDQENPKLLVYGLTTVHNRASAVSIIDDQLYVAEFYNGTNYLTNHQYEYNGEKANALLMVYDINMFLNDEQLVPNNIFTLPDKAQGVVKIGDYLYVSTSYGLASSYLKKYDVSKAKILNSNEQNINFLGSDSLIASLKMPPMSEDLCIVDNKVVTSFESASNLYIFGKIFHAFNIVMIDF